MAVTTSLGPSLRAYAALPSGIHAIAVDRAAAILRHGADPEGAGGPAPLVWIDVANPGDEEAEFLREQCGFHPLAVEDCVRGRQRPKIDRYPGFLFVVFYVAAINPERHRMALNELNLFLGEQYLVTVHDHEVREVSEIVARWRSSPQRFPGVGWLAHALLDAIVDDYFPVLDHFAQRAEQFESAVFERLEAANMQQILLLRHQLVLFRRVVAPGRDVLSNLLRRDLPFLQPELLPYFQDVHDHTIRVMEGIDAMRELLSAAMEAQLTVASNRLNQTMRMLTAWSIILMSMAVVTGVYGMNFVFMPELEWRWGYFGALALVAVIGATLYALFRRRGWL